VVWLKVAQKVNALIQGVAELDDRITALEQKGKEEKYDREKAVYKIQS
jgi:hypothetical protein